jgi:hypothetical protein
MLVVGGCLRWPGDCSWSRLTVLLLGRLLGVLFFTGARSMGHAVQWSPMKPESWSGWFPLKSSPTCSSYWLHCDFQNVPREHANCTSLIQLVTGPCHLTSRSRSYFTTDSQSLSMSWHRVPLWDLRPDIISCRNVTVWNLRSCIWGLPSLTRGRVYN